MKKVQLVFAGAQEKDLQTFLRAIAKTITSAIYVDANIKGFLKVNGKNKRKDYLPETFSVTIYSMMPEVKIIQSSIDMIVREITTSTGARFISADDRNN